MRRVALVISGINPWSSNISKYSEVWLSSLYFKKPILMSPKMKTSFQTSWSKEFTRKVYI